MSIVRWTGAAAVVCALHVGVMLALMHRPHEEADETAGSIAVELAPLPAVVRVDSPAVAHGPDQRKEQPTPQVYSAAVQELNDLPTFDPSPAPDPEVALPRPQPEENDKPAQEVRNDAPDAERVHEVRAALPTAPPRIDAQRGPAASPGQAAAVAPAQARWYRRVFRHLERFKLYPDVTRRLGQHGSVVVSFRVDRSGHIASSRILKGSGVERLDEEALAILARSSPLPLPPEQVAERDLELTGTIHFKLE